MKRPNLVLHATLGTALKVFTRLKGQRIRNKMKIKGPAIVLSNHTSFYDFMYTFASVYPRRITYFAADKMMFDPGLGKYLRLARAIPKCLFQPDVQAVMKAFQILDQKGIIGVFPEGQISASGTFLKPSFAIAKFLKKAAVDVYTVKHLTAYLVNPPWSKRTFSGRIETKMDIIISGEEISKLSLDEIYSRVCNGLSHSVAAYNQEKKYRFKANDIANLESVIYQCPQCLHKGLTASYDHLVCPTCHFELHYDTYGMLNGQRLDQLYFQQAKRIEENIESNANFELKHTVKLESYRDKRLVTVGEGTITLNTDEYRYQGTIDNEEKTLSFHPKNVPYLPSDLGKNIQIYEGYQIYQFVFAEKHIATEYVLAGIIIHNKHIFEGGLR